MSGTNGWSITVAPTAGEAASYATLPAGETVAVHATTIVLATAAQAAAAGSASVKATVVAPLAAPTANVVLTTHKASDGKSHNVNDGSFGA